MNRNVVILAISILFPLTSNSNQLTSSERDKMLSLMKDAEPYVVGMGKSAVEVCHNMANDMVSKYGKILSEIGKSPSEIRGSSLGICLDAVSSSENAQSSSELDMWKTSSLKTIEQQLNGDARKPSPKDFLIESVNTSVRIAKPIYYMKELSEKKLDIQ